MRLLPRGGVYVIEQVIGQAMQLKPIGIHYHRRETDRAKVKAVFPLFDKVFHGSAVAVEADDNRHQRDAIR